MSSKLVYSPVHPTACCSVANGVRALLEYLTTVPQIVGTLVWMSAMKAAVTLSASRLGNEIGRVLKTQQPG